MAPLDKIRKFEFDKYIYIYMAAQRQHILFLCTFIYLSVVMIHLYVRIKIINCMQASSTGISNFSCQF